MTRLEIAAWILAGLAQNGRHTEEVFKSGGYNSFEKLRAYNVEQALGWADALIAEELATRAKPPHVHEFPARWEWDGKPGRNIKRYCKCGQVEFGAIGEP